MTLWRAVLSGIDMVLGPAWRRMLLGVFLAGLGYLAFLPAFEGRQEAAQVAALIEFASTGRLALAETDAAFDLEALNHSGPWPGLLAGEGRAGYASSEQTAPVALPATPAGTYRAHPLTLVVLAPARQLAQGMSWPSQIRLYRLIVWSIALLGFAASLAGGLRYGYLDAQGAVVMAAWPFVFPHFFAQMTTVGGAGVALGCFGVVSAALMALSRRNELTASLVLGLALGLGIWADTLMMAIWAGLAGFFLWRGWRLRQAEQLDAEWVILRLFAMGLALLIGAGWVTYALISGAGLSMTPVLGPGFLARFWTSVASFSADGGASMILPGPGWRLVPLSLLALILIRWEFHWRALPPLAKAPAFVLPVFVLTILLMGLQGHATGFEELHMLAPVLALIMAMCCRSSALYVALICLGGGGALALGLLQASVFSGCAVFEPGLGRYGYENASCLLDWTALEAVSAPAFALKALGAGLISAASALFTLWRQASWQSGD